jgi:SAM-dependent methyltransferase
VPLLLHDNFSVFDVADVAGATATKTARSGLRRLVPDVSANPGAADRYREMARELTATTQEPLVLVVGAGEGGAGTETLAASGVRLVRSDVAIGPNTDLCLDAHRIPFADNTFDGLVAQAVLEHVADPYECVREFGRVLKPGGVVYAETPFMQQVHMGAHDFTRFTPLGHRRLFRQFDELSSGVAVGPGSALAWSLVYFFVSFSRGRTSRRVLNVGSRFAFFWLRYLDRFLVGRAAATDAAAGVYFLGRLSEDVLSDRELLSLYPGSIT